MYVKVANPSGPEGHYAIVKYVALLKAGVAKNDVKIVLLRKLSGTKIMPRLPLASTANG